MDKKTEFYNKSRIEFQKLFSELYNSIENLDFDERYGNENIVLEKTIQLEEMTGSDSYTQELFGTINDKKLLFNSINDDLRCSLIKLFSQLSNHKIKSAYEKMTYMHIYIRNLTLHILNYRAFNKLFDLPIDEFTLGLISKLDGLNKSMVDQVSKSMESSLTKSDDILILLMNLYKSDGLIKSNSDVKNSKSRDEATFRELFFTGFQYLITIKLDYDLTKGLDREKNIMFNDNNLLDCEEKLEHTKISASDIDYKFYEDDTDLDVNHKKNLNRELKKVLGFDNDDVELVMNKLFEKTDVITCKSRIEWIHEIQKMNISESIANDIFNYFAYRRESIVDNGNYYSHFVQTKSKIEEALFIEIHKDEYITNKTILKWGTNLFHQLSFNSPRKYLGSNYVVDKISDSFCSEVESLLVDNFEEITTFKNFYLNDVCKSDCEIDVLAIQNNTIIILECKRLGFTRDQISAKNQKKHLEEKYTKQLNNQIAAVKSNYEKIIAHFNKECKPLSKKNDYKVLGFIITKELSYAHFNNNTSHIIHVNKLIEHLREIL